MGQLPGQYYQQGYPPPPPMVVQTHPTNGLGIAGFIVSLVGLFFGCVLCPIGLLLSFFALFRRPRGFAIAGFIIGLIGSIIPTLFLAFFGFILFTAISFGVPGVKTMVNIEQAHQKVDSAALLGTDSSFGGDFYRTMLVERLQDGWGHSLRYTKSPGGYRITSSGPDGAFDTSDDLTQDYREPVPPKPER